MDGAHRQHRCHFLKGEMMHRGYWDSLSIESIRQILSLVLPLLINHHSEFLVVMDLHIAGLARICTGRDGSLHGIGDGWDATPGVREKSPLRTQIIDSGDQAPGRGAVVVVRGEPVPIDIDDDSIAVHRSPSFPSRDSR